MTSNPESHLASIDSLESFLAFLRVLEMDARADNPVAHAAGSNGWENGTIAAFLDAMHAWATDSGALSSTPSWQDVAKLLLAGKHYE